MPELPEVETVVRTLRPRLCGQTIAAVWTSGLALRMGRGVDGAALRAHCQGATVGAVSRRAKYILIDLERRGRAAGTLLVHLGMTGRLRVEGQRDPRAKHTHVAWTLSGGRELRFVDPRRFGWVLAAADVRALPEIAALGPDALAELDAKEFGQSLAKAATPIKSFLLDQRRIAGLGNIYVSEALFRARIHPLRLAHDVAPAASQRLTKSIRQVLAAAIRREGSSFDSYYRTPEGRSGRYQERLLVYGRTGQPCRRCGTTIQRIVVAQRGTHVCPRCQPTPPAGRCAGGRG